MHGAGVAVAAHFLLCACVSLLFTFFSLEGSPLAAAVKRGLLLATANTPPLGKKKDTYACIVKNQREETILKERKESKLLKNAETSERAKKEARKKSKKSDAFFNLRLSVVLFSFLPF
jgi:hypothetical protein